MLDVVIIFLSTVGCLDYDSEFYNNFDSAMNATWGIDTYSYCLWISKDGYPQTPQEFEEFRDKLYKKGYQIVFVTAKGVSENANGEAYARGADFALVKNDLGSYVTVTLSHEILHLWFQEQYDNRECWVLGVHRHAYLTVWSHDVEILDRFDCWHVPDFMKY